MKKFILIIAVTLAVSTLLSVIPNAVAQTYQSVKAVKIISTKKVSTVECNGTLEAAKKEQISFASKIKLTNSYFKIGDYVKKGDRLFDFDKTATMQALLSSSNEANSDTGSSALDTSNAEATLKKALDSGLIGQSTYDSLLQKAQSTEQSSEQTQTSGKNDAQNSIENIDKNLYAPISGIVTDITSSGTGFTQANETLIEITDRSSLQARVHIDESQIKNIKAGQSALISGLGFSGTYTGSVQQIYPTASDTDTDSGSKKMVDAIIKINNIDDNLKPGLTVNVIIRTSEKSGELVAPFETIKQDESGIEYVMVFDKGRAVRKNISTGQEYEDGEEVIKGIKSGDILIKDPSDNIYNGCNVRIIK